MNFLLNPNHFFFRRRTRMPSILERRVRALPGRQVEPPARGRRRGQVPLLRLRIHHKRKTGRRTPVGAIRRCDVQRTSFSEGRIANSDSDKRYDEDNNRSDKKSFLITFDVKNHMCGFIVGKEKSFFIPPLQRCTRIEWVWNVFPKKICLGGPKFQWVFNLLCYIGFLLKCLLNIFLGRFCSDTPLPRVYLGSSSSILLRARIAQNKVGLC